MNEKIDQISERHFRTKYDRLGDREKHVAHHLAERTPISRNVGKDLYETMTFGEKMADKVASFGGSWVFISIFAVIMVAWVILNSFVLIRLGKPFDPFPYILLNLFLSMLAAIQAPIILMSQNRQASKDRASAEHDYEVNLKAEIEILTLHEKIDSLRERQWSELLSLQQEQLRLLGALTGTLPKSP